MSLDDARAHLGVGWGFPVRPVGGKLQWARDEDDIDQAVEIVLRTIPGERAMLPEFGAGVRRQVFEPNAAPTHRALESSVRQALIDWEPRIQLEGVSAEPEPGSENLVLVHVDYLVRATNTFYNRVFPFYLTESGA